MKLVSLSVDLDEIHHYVAIHGATELDESLNRHAVYDIAIDRFLGFAQEHRIPLTFFAVGADLTRPENSTRLTAVARAGHELANHSANHLYDLTQRTSDEVQVEVQGGSEAIEAATGRKPVGFRAPGYTLDDRLVRVLEQFDVLYDSSVFPCPAYYASKLGVLATKRLFGRRSASIVGSPVVLACPRRPYRLGTPYWRPGNGLLELPIQVTRRLRLPFIGTALMLAGPARARWLARGVMGEPFVNLELHGIDLLDVGDRLPGLERHQPDLRISRQTKLETLHNVVAEFTRSGYDFVTLEQAARVHLRQHPVG